MYIILFKEVCILDYQKTLSKRPLIKLDANV